MEKGLRECCRSMRIGKILIRRDEDTNTPKVWSWESIYLACEKFKNSLMPLIHFINRFIMRSSHPPLKSARFCCCIQL